MAHCQRRAYRLREALMCARLLLAHHAQRDFPVRQLPADHICDGGIPFGDDAAVVRGCQPAACAGPGRLHGRCGWEGGSAEHERRGASAESASGACAARKARGASHAPPRRVQHQQQRQQAERPQHATQPAVPPRGSCRPRTLLRRQHGARCSVVVACVRRARAQLHGVARGHGARGATTRQTPPSQEREDPDVAGRRGAIADMNAFC